MPERKREWCRWHQPTTIYLLLLLVVRVLGVVLLLLLLLVFRDLDASALQQIVREL